MTTRLTSLTSGLTAVAIALAVAAAAAAAPSSGSESAKASSTAPNSRAADAAGASLPTIVKDWASAWNAKAPERMAALFTADGTYEDLAFEASFKGRQNVAAWVRITNAAVRDARVKVRYAVRDGSRVAVRWTFSGRDTGAFAPNLPATNKAFSVPVISTFELRGSKLKRVTDVYNLATVLRQVGLPSGAYTPPGAGASSGQ